jgi:hypothetical protein
MVASTVGNNDVLQLFYNAYLFGCDDNVAAFAILGKNILYWFPSSINHSTNVLKLLLSY